MPQLSDIYIKLSDNYRVMFCFVHSKFDDIEVLPVVVAVERLRTSD